MNKRTYNPLTEGYSGKKADHYGYTGKVTTSNIPKTMPSIKSAVTKPSNIEKSKASKK